MNKSAVLILATVTISLLAIVTAYSQEDMTHVDNSVLTIRNAWHRYLTMKNTTRPPAWKNATNATTFTKTGKNWKTNRPKINNAPNATVLAHRATRPP